MLKWLVPLGMLGLVVAYELGPARWLHERLGATAHLLAEIALYGTVGPALAFVMLDLVGRWLDERETSELQADILARARERSRLSQRLSDDVLQGLFAVSVLLASLESSLPHVPPEAASQLREAERMLDRAIRQLREYLLDKPAGE